MRVRVTIFLTGCAVLAAWTSSAIAAPLEPNVSRTHGSTAQVTFVVPYNDMPLFVTVSATELTSTTAPTGEATTTRSLLINLFQVDSSTGEVLVSAFCAGGSLDFEFVTPIAAEVWGSGPCIPHADVLGRPSEISLELAVAGKGAGGGGRTQVFLLASITGAISIAGTRHPATAETVLEAFIQRDHFQDVLGVGALTGGIGGSSAGEVTAACTGVPEGSQVVTDFSGLRGHWVADGTGGYHVAAVMPLTLTLASATSPDYTTDFYYRGSATIDFKRTVVPTFDEAGQHTETILVAMRLTNADSSETVDVLVAITLVIYRDESSVALMPSELLGQPVPIVSC